MNYQYAMGQALKVLARRDCSRKLLQERLLIKSCTFDICEQVLDDLELKNFLSDRRFSETCVRKSIAKLRGPLRIAEELEKKGVSLSVISDVLSRVHNWQEIALRSAQKKVSYGELSCSLDKGQLKERTEANKKKVFSHLSYQGFDYDIIEDVVTKLERGEVCTD